MATITKTYTEDARTSYKDTWTIKLSKNDTTLSASTFEFPTVTASHTGNSKGYGSVKISGQYADSDYNTFGGVVVYNKSASGGGVTSFASGTTYTIPITSGTINTSSIFNSYNPTVKTRKLYFIADIALKSASNSAGTTKVNSYSSIDNTLGAIVNVTLNTPPTFSTPTVSKDTNWWYAGLTTMTVSVPITYSSSGTSATAKYGGYVKKIELDVGGQKVSKTFTESTKPTSAQTLSMTLPYAGTFTPTVTVTDSRDQSTTVSLSQITVNQYNVPSVNFDVYRSSSAGVKDDEGHYALIKATMAYTSEVADLTTPTVSIKDDNNQTVSATTTWYSSYSESTGVSSAISDWSTVSTGDEVYGIIDADFANTGNFSEGKSYQVTLTETDTQNGTSTAITQTLSTAFYTIDFQAGGKEIAFGAPANDDLTDYPDGLFKCNMDMVLNNDLSVNGAITSTGDITDGNGNILSNKADTSSLPSTTTPTISITTTTGSLTATSIRQFGKVVQLSISVKNTSSTASGDNIYEGTISTTELRPAITTTGATYYGANAFTATISTAGSIVVRNSTASAFAVATSNINISFTYIVA